MEEPSSRKRSPSAIPQPLPTPSAAGKPGGAAVDVLHGHAELHPAKAANGDIADEPAVPRLREGHAVPAAGVCPHHLAEVCAAGPHDP